MLGWIALLGAIGVAALLGWWATHRFDELGRKNDLPWFGLVPLLVIAVVAGGFWWRHHAEEDRLSAVASALVGHPVRVICQSYSGSFVDAEFEPGYVRYGADGVPEPRTTIKADECATMRHYLHSSKKHPSEAQTIAVHILTHESMHMRGITDEAEAECQATAHDAETARLLGAPEQGARFLALSYWTSVYPRMPDGYRSAACRGPQF